MLASEIKPCPFCGSDEIEIEQTHPEAIWFRCSNCGAETSAADHVDKALSIWNQRYEQGA